MLDTTLDTMTVREAAERRRSIRSYEPVPVEPGDLEAIFEVVRRAPSAFNVQPWRFVVVETPELRARVAEAAYSQPQAVSAPVLVVLYTDVADALRHVDEVLHPGMDESTRSGARESILRSLASRDEATREGWGAEQGYIALGYLLLAAEAQGYQTSPMLGFDADAVRKLLGLPAHVRIPAVVALGRGAEGGFEHHRHPLERIVRAA